MLYSIQIFIRQYYIFVIFLLTIHIITLNCQIFSRIAVPAHKVANSHILINMIKFQLQTQIIFVDLICVGTKIFVIR